MNDENMQSETVTELINDAVEAGDISPAAAMVVTAATAASVQDAVGAVHEDDITASTVVVFAILPDDSGSMAGQKAQAARDGINQVLNAISATEEAKGGGILVHIRPFNGRPLCPFVKVQDAPRLTQSNFEANGGTPLYDRYVEGMSAVIAEGRRLAGLGIAVRHVTLIVTDGEEAGSTEHHTPESVAPLTLSALQSETHVVAFMGVGESNFRDVAARMGILPKWVLTTNGDGHSLRQAFGVVSRAFVQVSRGTTDTGFEGGGFGK